MKPMLAEAGEEPFDSPNHIFDWKWNGIRILGLKEGEEVQLQGRSGAVFTDQFPELADLGEHIKVERAWVDGEVVCLGEDGLPDFNRIQHRFAKRETMAINLMAQKFPATYMVFDVVMVEGFDLTAGSESQATQMHRKELLDRILVPDGHIKLAPWVDTYGKALHQEAVRLNQEGIMAKTKTGLYHPGGRTLDWVKLKVPKYGRFVIGGYTAGTGWRESMMGAVVLGQPTPDGLRWVGCAGSGFTNAVLKDVHQALQSIETTQSPFLPGTKVPKLVSWVKPILVAEVKYYDITKGGQLIWPIFQRVRTELTVSDLISP